MMPVPPGAYSCSVVRDWDRRAIEEYGIPAAVLMENAGRGAAEIIDRLVESAEEIEPPFHIFCGPGNNGGDGFVVARHLHNRGYSAELTVISGGEYATDSTAALNFEIVRRMQLPLHWTSGKPAESDIPRAGTTIDALFGTGLSRKLESPYADWVHALAAAPAAVIALDAPSGLNADSGAVWGVALPARHTITFAARKLAFTRPECAPFVGTVHVVDIGMPRAIWASTPPSPPAS